MKSAAPFLSPPGLEAKPMSLQSLEERLRQLGPEVPHESLIQAMREVVLAEVEQKGGGLRSRWGLTQKGLAPSIEEALRSEPNEVMTVWTCSLSGTLDECARWLESCFCHEKSVAFGGKRKRSAAGLASIAPGEADGYAAWLGREVRPLHPAFKATLPCNSSSPDPSGKLHGLGFTWRPF
eukprot:s7351_g2.t1